MKTAPKTTFFLLIIFTLFTTITESKITSQTRISDGIDPTTMKIRNVFFYNNQIIVPIESYGNTYDLRSYLYQYSITGELLKTITFPLQCPYLSNYFDCSFEFREIIVMDNWMIAYLGVEDEGDNVLYKVDLDSFSIVEENDLNHFNIRERYPQAIIQFNDQEIFWIDENLVGLSSVFPIRTTDLKFLNKTHYLPINDVSIGGSTSSLSSQNLFFVCGDTDPYYFANQGSYNLLFNADTKKTIWHAKAGYGCDYSSFLGNTSLLAQVVNVGGKTGVGLVDLSSSPSSLPSSLSYQIIWKKSQPKYLLADNENLFVFVAEEYYGENGQQILQVNIGNENSPDLVILDSLILESGYAFNTQLDSNIQSLGVNPNGGQFAYIADYSTYYNYNSSIFVVNYDNLKNPYY